MFSAMVFFGVGKVADGLQRLDGAASGANLTGDIASELSAAKSSTWASGGVGRAALHAAGGCITSVAGGGKCGQGAFTAGLGKLVSSHAIDFGNDRVLGTLQAAFIGGTLSVIGGGKFANGAQTGAFQYLFNQASRRGLLGRGLLGRGGLSAHEEGAARGHTLARHVSIADDLVEARVAGGKQAASKFYSREIAEESINRALIVNDSKLIQFVHSNEARWKNLDSLELKYNHQGRVGWGVVEGQAGRIHTTEVIVTVTRNASMPGGYQIVRAFPNVVAGPR
jgi:Bacterial CdiA-CT RNAse A domain